MFSLSIFDERRLHYGLKKHGKKKVSLGPLDLCVPFCFCPGGAVCADRLCAKYICGYWRRPGDGVYRLAEIDRIQFDLEFSVERKLAEGGVSGILHLGAAWNGILQFQQQEYPTPTINMMVHGVNQ